MPIIARRNVYRFIVAELQGVGFAELGYGLVVPSENAQVVAIHVLGMRNRGAEPGVNLTVFHGFLSLSDRLESMHQIMLGSRISGRNCQSCLIVGNGTHESTLAAACCRGLFGVSTQQPEFWVIRAVPQPLSNPSFLRLHLP